MKNRELCLALTKRKGHCQNYRDTCPIKAHRKARAKIAPTRTDLLTAHRPTGSKGTMLSDDPALFREVVGEAESAYGIRRDLIVGDYWLVRTLHAWLAAVGDDALPRGYPDPSLPAKSQNVGRMVFGGGTSLSASWGITQRWSRDIDLMLDPGEKEGPKRLRQACQKAAMATSALLGCSFRVSSKSAEHYFFSIRDRYRDEVSSVDIVHRRLDVAPIWAQKMPVMSMIGRVCDAGVLDAHPELGGFEFNTLGPGTTAMNKLLAQTEMSASGNLDSIRGRARDVYDLARIAGERGRFEGHIGRDSKALLWIAESWIDDEDRRRPADGFESIRSFDPSTREYEALAVGYEAVMEDMVWGERIPLPEAIAQALSLDPGPAEPPPPPDISPLVAHPRQ